MDLCGEYALGWKVKMSGTMKRATKYSIAVEEIYFRAVRLQTFFSAVLYAPDKRCPVKILLVGSQLQLMQRYHRMDRSWISK
jgi:hypothetical protein